MAICTPRGIDIRHKETGQTILSVHAHSLAGADLREAQLAGARLACADLKRATLVQANLRGAELRAASLFEASLTTAALEGANLESADLRGADLRAANLARANLQGAVLCSANLEGACLAGADLRWSNLTGAMLTNADLRGADFRGAFLPKVVCEAQSLWAALPSEEEACAGAAGSGRLPRHRAMLRRVGKPGPGTLQLWTVQDLLVWRRLQEQGELYPDPARVRPEYVHAYEWMSGQMTQRRPGYPGGLPWWAWYGRKPDLRQDARLQVPGARRVRLELAVPAEEVLLSDHFSWHWVLNRSFVPLTAREGEEWDAQLALHGVDVLEWPLPEPWRQRLVASWERVLDFTTLYSGGMWMPQSAVQATFSPLRREHVVEVTEFLGR